MGKGRIIFCASFATIVLAEAGEIFIYFALVFQCRWMFLIPDVVYANLEILRVSVGHDAVRFCIAVEFCLIFASEIYCQYQEDCENDSDKASFIHVFSLSALVSEIAVLRAFEFAAAFLRPVTSGPKCPRIFLHNFWSVQRLFR